MYSMIASILANEYATCAFLLVAWGSAFLSSHLQLQLDKTIVTDSAAMMRKRLGLRWGIDCFHLDRRKRQNRYKQKAVSTTIGTGLRRLT